MVDVDDRGLDLDALVAEELELHHRHRPGGVLGERLVDRDRDLRPRERARRGSRCSSRIVRASEAIGLSIQERADSFRRTEILVRSDRTDRPAVRDGLVHSEVETVVALLGLGAVERAPAACRGQPPARRALPGLVLDAFLVEQDARPSVGGGLERLGPAGRGSLSATGRLSPALEHLFLLASARLVEDRRGQLVQLVQATRAPRRVVQPTTALSPPFESSSSSSARVSSEETTITFGASILRTRRSISSATSRRCSRDELLDVALEASLRPAALVVPAGNLVAAVDDLVEPARAQPEELAALAPDEGDDRALAAADERHERRDVELLADVDPSGTARSERDRPPDVVKACGEDGQPLRAVAIELVREALADTLEVLLERDALVVCQAVTVDPQVALALVEQRADSGVDVVRGRRLARVEVDVEADRAPVLRPELRQLPKPSQLTVSAMAVLSRQSGDSIRDAGNLHDRPWPPAGRRSGKFRVIRFVE